jgi:hypothetical protein
MNDYDIARICHEANRALCIANGDQSQELWDHAPDWQRVSAVKGVEFVRANPHACDDALHKNWMVEKAADGWGFGEVKDANAKTHPCMVPFDQLPPHQQAKDRLFRAIVLALI